MKTFPNWRNVGRAMLDARRREGVTVKRTRSQYAMEHHWRHPDGSGVLVTRYHGAELVDVQAGGDLTDCRLNDCDDAATVLRVLAALGLVPADIAYAADERYGRCQVCGRLARWWAAEAGAAARWVHQMTGDERFINYPAHLAEVAS